MKKLLAMLLAAIMLMSMVGVLAETAEELGTPLVVAQSTLSGKFSPYYADTGYDVEVVDRTQIAMMTTDRVGAIVYNGIEGETHNYNGTDYTYYGTGDLSVNYDADTDITTYGYHMRDDMVFSDGVPVTIDDVIFNYYVFLDPAYNGSNTLSSYNILGLQAYRTQIPEASLEQVNPVIDAVKEAGPGYELTGEETFSQAAYDAYYNKLEELWKADCAAMIDYMFENYAEDYAADMIGRAADELAADDGLKAAFGSVLWGFGEYDPETDTFTTSDGKAFKLGEGERPTAEDYFNATYAAYEGDFGGYAGTESELGLSGDEAEQALSAQIVADLDIDMSAGVKSVSGITRVDDYTVEVKVKGFDAAAVYSILALQIAPMHYYGDPEQYDYENGLYGHPFGDLSTVQAVQDVPVGAGPYKFVKYENRVVYYEANENFFMGAPLIKSFQYKETNSAEVATAVQTGAADGGELNGTKANFEMLRSFNSNGELDGDVVTTYSVANLGYGYIGLNADTMNVAGDPGSDASKNLRKGFATVLSVYRDTAFDSYYGDAAAVINYPISTTSWAAPQPTDEGYRVAYSVDVDGNPIYTAEMSQEEKYAAAIEAAKGFFIAAGYTFDEASGVFTAAPEGASLSYEVIIPADGIGDHPSFAVLTDARNALATIGIELKINDPADDNVLWDALDAGTQNMWCAAWQSTIDPDMYQTYHSSNIVGLGGSDSNHYHIQSAELDQMILDARKSDDQAYRKQIYRACLDEIMDWAVEIPAYQRQNIVIASTERVNIDTVTPDVTTYWSWLADLETMQMNETK